MKPKQRPKSHPVSDEMKAWSSALGDEAAEWPNCTARSFFGFTALYRGSRMFAALPRTRALWTPNSLAFKLEGAKPEICRRLENDRRISSTRMENARWFAFEVGRAGDLHEVLDWLGLAYEAAGKRKKSG